MIRSSDGVRLLSSHLIQIYEGVFHRNLDSGICTLSRVIGVRVVGHGTVNPNNRLLSNTSIRGSVSLSRPDYERHNYLGWKPRPPIKGVSEKDFQKGFKHWCKKHDYIFSSEGEKEYMFKWFRDNYRYGREFYCGSIPEDDLSLKFGDNEAENWLEKFRIIERYQGEDQEEDQEEVFYSNKLRKEYQEKRCCPCCYIGSDRLPDIERGT